MAFQLNSKAKIVDIKRFYRVEGRLIKSSDSNEFYIEWGNYNLDWNPQSKRFESTPDLMLEDFPVIYQSDGTPWDLGNLYLYWWWNSNADYNAKSISTIKRKAKHLLHYLQWLEDSQSLGKPYHAFYAPKGLRPRQRVTYQYKRYLQSLYLDNTNTLSVVKGKAAEVAQFYMFLNQYNLQPPDMPKIEGHLYRIKQAKRFTPRGTAHQIVYTDIHITESMLKENDSETIGGEDGKVSPLSTKEKNWVLEGLEALGDRQMQLMHWLGLYSGARKQTICTLTVDSIKKAYIAYQGSVEARVKVGPGTGIDTKKNVNYVLRIPFGLVKAVYNWIVRSPIYKERRAISFYGESDQNYCFLTKNGNPFYVAQRHRADAQNPDLSHTLVLRDRGRVGNFIGNSINDFDNQRLIPWIKEHKDSNWMGFRFHDLRATKGMEFVRKARVTNMTPTDIILEVMSILGHRSELSTQRYLDFDELVKDRRNKNRAVENALYNQDFPWDTE